MPFVPDSWLVQSAATEQASPRTAAALRSPRRPARRRGRQSAYRNLVAFLRKLLYSTGMLDVDDLEATRQRSAVVARALADAKRLCVLQSLAGGELSSSPRCKDFACSRR